MTETISRKKLHITVGATKIHIDGLSADIIDGQHVVRDEAGGVWWPSDEATAEIKASDDPEATALRIARDEPMGGVWRQ